MCEEDDNGCKHPGLTLPEEKGKIEPECPLKVKKCPHFYVQIEKRYRKSAKGRNSQGRVWERSTYGASVYSRPMNS
ncbi:PREDICTED: uncharacterized protein LOC105590123 [Cercocebus atys]|uniref:uncharacterized protein LOC105590123 n=1 Tax=Cercocebus atys TaxID=9531 RepID=UPI0005F5778B|nr:PREDICTED: uncharacterized protein LOC105590123 [Cercocebus atys]